MGAKSCMCRGGMLLVIVCAGCGCQVYNSGREVRGDEQMLPISFENARAEELFIKAVKTTYGEKQNATTIGVPGCTLYSHGETVAWNANCNDHIREMDKDGDLVITTEEAELHYASVALAKRR